MPSLFISDPNLRIIYIAYTVETVIFDLRIDRNCRIQPQTRLSRILHNPGSVNPAAVFFCRILRFSFYMTTQIMIFQSIYSAHKNNFLAPNFPMRSTSFAVYGGRFQIMQSFPKAALDGATHSLRFIGPTAFY